MLSITLRNNLDILFHLLSRKGILGEDDMLAVGLSFLTLICMLSVLEVEFFVSPKATSTWMLLVLSFDCRTCSYVMDMVWIEGEILLVILQQGMVCI